jgi:pilus assembly protein Flp/PilA
MKVSSMIDYLAAVVGTKLAPILRLKRDARAVTALEYGLIAALIAVVIITAVTAVGTKLSTVFSTVASSTK